MACTQQVAVIGGVPVMLKASDMCNTIPDEKTVVTYLSYLCARLFDVRNETHAAFMIQSAWRSYRNRHPHLSVCSKHLYNYIVYLMLCLTYRNVALSFLWPKMLTNLCKKAYSFMFNIAYQDKNALSLSYTLMSYGLGWG